MTYYGDENGAVTDLEQNRLDVMPADTLNAPDVPRLERTSGVRVYHSPAIGLEYWVFNLAPRVTSRVHKEVVQSRAIRVALAWAIDRSALVQAALQGYGAPATRSSRATTAPTRSTSPRIRCSATTTTPRRRSASSTRPAGESVPTASATTRTACAPRSSSPTRASRPRSERSR